MAADPIEMFLKWELFFWTEEDYRNRLPPTHSAELFAADAKAIREQIAKWQDCTPEEVHLGDMDPVRVGNVFHAREVAYPSGIGDFMLVCLIPEEE